MSIDIKNNKTEKKKTVGLYFGSFNPIHNGHISVVNRSLSNDLVDEVWIMVSPQNPLKDDSTLAPFEERVKMAELVFSHTANVKISSFENTLSKPSYTIDTMNALQEKYPNESFSIIIGSDLIPEVIKWKNGDLLLSRFSFILFERGGIPIVIPENIPIKILASIDQGITVSSSHIRGCLEKHVSLEGLIPALVEEYIISKKLYK